MYRFSLSKPIMKSLTFLFDYRNHWGKIQYYIALLSMKPAMLFIATSEHYTCARTLFSNFFNETKQQQQKRVLIARFCWCANVSAASSIDLTTIGNDWFANILHSHFLCSANLCAFMCHTAMLLCYDDHTIRRAEKDSGSSSTFCRQQILSHLDENSFIFNGILIDWI